MLARSILTTTLFALAQTHVAGFQPPAQPPNMPCTWTDEAHGTTYDLTQLMPFADNEHPATVTDRIMMSNGEYKYTFGVCTTVAPPAACKNADGSSKKSTYWAPAWQTKVSDPTPADPSCYYIGSTEPTEAGPWYESNTKWSLLSEEDPAQGVSIEMVGGHHCSNGDQRKLRMNFRCVKHGIESFENQVVDEGAHCTYNISVDSHFACPTQCGFGSGRSACGEHGVCGYDTDAARSRCFCNEGYTGAGCGDKIPAAEDKDYGPILGLLVVVIIALAGFGAAGYFLFRWLQTRTMNISGDSYSKLEAQYGDSMVADHDSSAPPRMGISTGPSNI